MDTQHTPHNKANTELDEGKSEGGGYARGRLLGLVRGCHGSAHQHQHGLALLTHEDYQSDLDLIHEHS